MIYFVYYSSTVLPDGLSELSIKSVWKSLGFIITQSLPPELLPQLHLVLMVEDTSSFGKAVIRETVGVGVFIAERWD